MQCPVAYIAAVLLALPATVAALKVRDERFHSRLLDRHLQFAAAAAPPGPTRDLLSGLRLCAPCKSYERFGEPHDGGYVMCTDNLEGLVAAYSYGVNGFDGWGTAVSQRYGVPVYEYDCTDPRRPVGGDLRFHEECVKSLQSNSSDPRFKTLDAQLRESGQGSAAAGSLLLKMDIEGAEWEILAQEPASMLAKFRQVVLEFHAMNKDDQHPLYASAIKSLAEAGLVPTHLHGNNYEGMAGFGDFSIPNALEVTFVGRPQGGCGSGVPYHLAIDAPNNADVAELPDAVLPEEPSHTGSAAPEHFSAHWAFRRSHAEE